MNMKFVHLSFLVLIAFIAVMGCQQAQDMVDDVMPADDTMTDAEKVPVKLVWFIDYPPEAKEAYIEWVGTIAGTLQAPEEVVRIRSYDNIAADTSPNRLVAFEFESFLDAAHYLNRPEIAAVLEDLPNHTSRATVHTFIQRSDYAKEAEGEWSIRYLSLVDYPLDGKDAYLDWIDEIAPTLAGPPQVRAITSYDNYYGEAPHRLVAFEFASLEDYTTYRNMDAMQAIIAQMEDRTANWAEHAFELRSDYVKE